MEDFGFKLVAAEGAGVLFTLVCVHMHIHAGGIRERGVGSGTDESVI